MSEKIYIPNTINGKIPVNGNVTVDEFSGNYDDLSNKPTIPNDTVVIPSDEVLFSGADDDGFYISDARTPWKGDLITMSLGNAALAAGTQDLYRILSINGTKAFVMAMYDPTASQTFNDSSTTTTIGSKSGQKYQDSAVDTYLNNTFYSSLNDTAKSAIIAQDITQDLWYQNDSQGSPAYSGIGYTGYSYGFSLYSNSGAAYLADIGSKNIYLLSFRDIVNYVLSAEGGGSLTYSNIWKMFWNTTSQPSVGSNYWLRSAQDLSSMVVGVSMSSGTICGLGAVFANAVRPAFVIDLSKISYTLIQ